MAVVTRARLFVIGYTLILGVVAGAASADQTVSDVRLKMGSRFRVTVVHADEGRAGAAIENAYREIDRVEALISSWRESSETAAINRAAGVRPVTVSRELFALIRRSLKVSALTRGAFDITFASVGRLWDFKNPAPVIPDPDRLAAAMGAVGAAHVVLNDADSSVYLAHPGARIGFGAIGKGYAANRAVAVLKDAGITSGVVNAGGDLLAFGRREDGKPRVVGVADPRWPDRTFAHVRLANLAIVTSGDYEQFFLLDGRRYAHILDPRTGYPVDHSRSVTIICPDAELADALATGVFVLGPDDGLALIDQLRGVEGFLIDDAGQLRMSRNLTTLFAEEEVSP
jgi:thiamine biosynthesis lipoprotein